MKWTDVGAFLGGLISSIGDWITRPKAPPEPPAPAPEPPKMGEIDARIDEMLGRIEAEDAANGRAASEPSTILPPRTPVPSDAGERAGDVDAMRGNGPAIEERPEPPTVRKP